MYILLTDKAFVVAYSCHLPQIFLQAETINMGTGSYLCANLKVAIEDRVNLKTEIQYILVFSLALTQPPYSPCR